MLKIYYLKTGKQQIERARGFPRVGLKELRLNDFKLHQLKRC